MRLVSHIDSPHPNPVRPKTNTRKQGEHPGQTENPTPADYRSHPGCGSVPRRWGRLRMDSRPHQRSTRRCGINTPPAREVIVAPASTTPLARAGYRSHFLYITPNVPLHFLCERTSRPRYLLGVLWLPDPSIKTDTDTTCEIRLLGYKNGFVHAKTT